jgi:hypothetical protein
MISANRKFRSGSEDEGRNLAKEMRVAILDERNDSTGGGWVYMDSGHEAKTEILVKISIQPIEK